MKQPHAKFCAGLFSFAFEIVFDSINILLKHAFAHQNVSEFVFVDY